MCKVASEHCALKGVRDNVKFEQGARTRTIAMYLV
jgi:hypothetical protein